jgi:hypothetical protein
MTEDSGGVASYNVNIKSVTEVEKAVVAICHSSPIPATIFGTGFIVEKSGLIITLDYIADGPARLITFDYIIDNTARQAATPLFCLRPNQHTFETYELEQVARIKTGISGRHILVMRIKQSTTSQTFPCLKFGEGSHSGDSVITAGYLPHNDKGSVRPLIKHGMIAATQHSCDENKATILDMAFAKGFGGSPIIQLSTLDVVGVCVGENVNFMGFTVAYPLCKEEFESIVAEHI